MKKRPSHPELSKRESQILALLAAGSSMGAIASLLGIAYRTVAFHKYNSMRKLRIDTNAALLRYAFEENATSTTQAAQIPATRKS